MLSVLVGVLVGGAIAVQASDLAPSPVTMIVSALAVIPAWLLFAPSTAFSLWFMRKHGWHSLGHHLLTGSISAVTTVGLVLLAIAAMIGGFKLEQALWYLAGAAIGGFAAGYVYWGTASS
jgi:hypothetical protein